MSAPVTSNSTSDWTQNHGSSGSLSVNKPANVVDGDLILALCTSDQGSSSTTATFTPPAGFDPYPFNSLRGGSATGNAATLAAFVKEASSEGSSYNFSRSGGSSNWGVTLTRISHAGGTPVADMVNVFTKNDTGTNEATVAAAEAQADDTLTIALATWNESKTYSDAPPDYTLVNHTANSSNDMAVAQATIATSGGTLAEQSFNLSSGTQCATAVVLFTPPGGTPDPEPEHNAVFFGVNF